MKLLHRTLVAALSFSALGTGAAPVQASTAEPFPGGGAIELRLTDGSKNPSPSDLLLSLEYARIDPITPAQHLVSTPLESTQSLPAMVRKDGRLLTLQSLRMVSPEGSVPFSLDRATLLPLLKRARAGGRILLKPAPSKNGPAFTAAIEPAELEDYELPARNSGPGLSFSEVDLFDLLRLDEVEDSLLRTRAVSAATEAFHNELVELVQKAPSIDGIRLQLLLDSTPFSAPAMAAIRKRLRDLPASRESEEFRGTLSENLALGERLAPLGNRLFLLGMLKIRSLRYPEAEALLERLHTTADESNETAFSQAFDRLGGSYEALRPEEKLRLFSLAARQGAPRFAAPLGRDWFLKDSDKTTSAVLELVRQLPAGAARDDLSRLAALATGPISVSEFAALTAPIGSDEILLELYERVSSRITELTPAQLLSLLSQRPAGELRNSLLLMAAANLSSIDRDGLRNLVLSCSTWACRGALVRSVSAKIPGSPAAALGEILLILPAEADRDRLLLLSAELTASPSAGAVASLLSAALTEATAGALLDGVEGKLAPAKVTEFTAASDAMKNTAFAIEPFRDRLLIAAARLASDLSEKNLDQLLQRASDEAVRRRIRELAGTRAPEALRPRTQGR